MAYVSMADMQEKRNQMIADRQQSAHDRFVRRRTNFIESNPGAVSGMERQSFLGRQRKLEDDYELRKQEMDMLKQQGENALNVEKAKVEGMIGQGSKAAEFNAEASKYTADAQKEAALKKAEVDAANGAAQWGKFENGNFIPGSDVEKAKLTTQATLENARLERESKERAAELGWNSREKIATGKNAATVDAATIKANGDAAKTAAKAESDYQAKKAKVLQGVQKLEYPGMTPDQFNSMNGEEQDAWLESVGVTRSNAKPQQVQQPPPKFQEGQTQKLRDGRTAVFRNGKWTIAE